MPDEIVIVRILRRGSNDRIAHLSDGSEVRLSAEFAETIGEGETFEPAAWHRLVGESDRRRARDLALLYLGVKGRTVHQMREHLARRGIPEATTEDVVADLCARGYLGDERYAEDFVRERRQVHPQGGQLTRHQLARRGVDEETADEAIRTARQEEGLDEREEARRAARKWTARTGEEAGKARLRLARFLASRGFDEDVVRDVLAERLGEFEEPGELG
jgi:regulatory protein